jgi:hypothetical protein
MSELLTPCGGGLANSIPASIVEASGELEALFQKAMPTPRPASPTITIPAMIQCERRETTRSLATPTESEATVPI